jgi:hypothetical protein
VVTTYTFQLSSKLDEQKRVAEAAAKYLVDLVHPNILATHTISTRVDALGEENTHAPSFDIALVQDQSNGGTLRRAIQQGLFCRSMAKEQWRVSTGALQGVAAAMHFMHERDVCHGSLTALNVHLHVWCRKMMQIVYIETLALVALLVYILYVLFCALSL